MKIEKKVRSELCIGVDNVVHVIRSTCNEFGYMNSFIYVQFLIVCKTICVGGFYLDILAYNFFVTSGRGLQYFFEMYKMMVNKSTARDF